MWVFMIFEGRGGYRNVFYVVIIVWLEGVFCGFFYVFFGVFLSLVLVEVFMCEIFYVSGVNGLEVFFVIVSLFIFYEIFV